MDVSSVESQTNRDDRQEFRRVLGPISATCVVIGAIVGVGIFFTPAEVAAKVGSIPLAMLTWSIGGVIALLGALTFAELGGLYRNTGAQYSILRDAYAPSVSFFTSFAMRRRFKRVPFPSSPTSPSKISVLFFPIKRFRLSFAFGLPLS